MMDGSARVQRLGAEAELCSFEKPFGRSPEPLVSWFWKEHEMLTRESKAVIVPCASAKARSSDSQAGPGPSSPIP